MIKTRIIILLTLIIFGILMLISCDQKFPVMETPTEDLVEELITLATEAEIIPVNEPTEISPTLTPVGDETVATETIGSQSTAESVNFYWYAGFETGNLSEYEDALGEFLRQSQFGSYQITSSIARSGFSSAALTIDTSGLGFGQAAAAYLAFYDTPQAAYYSGWLYIPEEVEPQSWWNIWQWKSTYNGNSDDSLPMWSLDLGDSFPVTSHDIPVKLVYRPDDDSGVIKVWYENPSAVIPKGEWVHISTYYVKSRGTDGVVGVWINGEEVFYVENVNTTLSDNTLYWSVNNYSDSILPSPCTIYFDDMAISYEQVFPDTELP